MNETNETNKEEAVHPAKATTGRWSAANRAAILDYLLSTATPDEIAERAQVYRKAEAYDELQKAFGDVGLLLENFKPEQVAGGDDNHARIFGPRPHNPNAGLTPAQLDQNDDQRMRAALSQFERTRRGRQVTAKE